MDWLEIKEFFKDTFKYILVVIGVLLVALYVVTLEQVIGPSMSPTYKENDVVVLDKLYYKIFKINRGDIVSVSYADTKYLIKRVIGLPGEYVEIKDNQIYIDGKILEEPYLDNVENYDFDLRELGYEKIPDGYYLLLGDNRTDSLDSRDPKVGLISKKNFIGKVRFKIWPLFK